MNQSNHYTANDIERYYGGQLSAAEMHALERAALDDPFLADALEGYHHTQTPAHDLSVLQQKLQLRIEKEDRRRPVFYMGSRWMKVAALFILFAGSGWLVYQMLSGKETNTEKEVATTQSAKPQTPAVTEIAADSTNAIVSATPANPQTNTLEDKSTSNPTNTNDVVLGNSTAAQTATATAPQAKNEQFEEQANSLQEITTFRQSMPSDSLFLRNVTAAKEKDNAKSSAPDTIRNLNVIMQSTQVPAENVVVLSNKQAPQAKRRMQVVIDTLEPAEGWTNFDDYIASNLKTPEEYKSKPVKGEVELSFDVNRQGEPVNIAVVKSLCEKCDEEAIRLLKEGPRWKQNKKKGKVKIRF